MSYISVAALCEGGLCFQFAQSTFRDGTIGTNVQTFIYKDLLGTLGGTLLAKTEHCPLNHTECLAPRDLAKPTTKSFIVATIPPVP
jgi:hypothetical protein